MELSMMVSAAVGVAALCLGLVMNARFSILRRMCIPIPVTGGLVISAAVLLVHVFFGVEIRFDTTLQDVFMILFFTSVGFGADLKSLKRGGRGLVVMTLLMVLLVALQNGLGVAIARLLGEDALLGIACGSVSMVGGHGTAGGFAPLFESLGMQGAATISMTAATFGLIAGSLLGAPLATRLVVDGHLAVEGEASALSQVSGQQKSEIHAIHAFDKGFLQLIAAAGLGALLGKALALTGMVFPTYFGALVVGTLWRNLTGNVKGLYAPATKEIAILGEIMLYSFLGIAMSSLRLWELAGMALPMTAILAMQVVAVALFARYVLFPALGGDYDAAIMCAGMCGFGLGATPNAMANMSSVSSRFHYPVVPFIVIPIVGAMFIDLINTFVISFFLNFVV